jgi:hypothetical protein
VSKAIERLSKPKRRESPSPFDHSDFKGLIHRDYVDAIQNLTQEPTHIQRSTMRLLQQRPGSTVISLLEKKQAMSTGPDFDNEAVVTRSDFFVHKNKGFDRSKNSRTMKNIQEIYNRNRPVTSTPAPQFFHSRNSGKRAFSASRRATLQEEAHRENMEI